MKQGIAWKLKYRIVVLESILKGEIPMKNAWPMLFYPTSKVSTLTGEKEQRLLGKLFHIPPQSYGEYLGLLGEIIAADQYRAKNFIKMASIIIDAGANLGVFSRLASSLAPKGKIYAFEPAPKTFEMLSKNMEGYPNVNCIPLGLGDMESEKDLLILENWSGGNSMSDSVSAWELTPKEKVRVRITTIDQFVAEHNIPRVDFIKIDTEGYEAKILQGARETIKRFHPVIAMSAYHGKNDVEILTELIKKINPHYQCRLENRCEQDLICTPE